MRIWQHLCIVETPLKHLHHETQQWRDTMRRFLYENGLSLALLALFLVCILGQSIAGLFQYNKTQEDHGEPPVSYREYVQTGHFVEATFENWESEFLQMAAFVFMTQVLRQKGSAESRKLKEEEAEEEAEDKKIEEEAAAQGKTPWPVRKGGLVLKLYENSLTIAFGLLFFISFYFHALGGVAEFNEEQQEHGQPGMSLGRFLFSSEFWFQSFQNWQSEFLAVFAIVILSIFLRDKDSAESKPVGAAHSHTGR